MEQGHEVILEFIFDEGQIVLTNCWGGEYKVCEYNHIGELIGITHKNAKIKSCSSETISASAFVKLYQMENENNQNPPENPAPEAPPA